MSRMLMIYNQKVYFLHSHWKSMAMNEFISPRFLVMNPMDGFSMNSFIF